ncbi:unnamed protein product [Anisakis simplex]|uniref:Antenna complex alpha/beta subunit n=1 Tax=Anisakis simplex TaxID=6269 RepID=A0A0M3J7N8_ANISI|nr:unnamed protein product [Anisakis simplex]
MTGPTRPKLDAEYLKTAKEQFLAVDYNEIHELDEAAKKEVFESEIVWRNVAVFVILHVLAVFGLYHLIFTAKWLTVGWSELMSLVLL